jgi:LPS export ABC transporter protein LptC
VGVGFLIALAAFFLARSGKDSEDRSSLPELVPGEGVKLKEVRYRQDDPDRGLKWALDASEVLFSDDNDRVFFKNFVLRLEPVSRPPMRLTGGEGEYIRKTGIIMLKGQVEGVSDDGYRIITEGVTIEEKTKRARSDSPVKAWGPFFTIQGNGLFVDLEEEIFRINKEVTTIVKGKTATP